MRSPQPYAGGSSLTMKLAYNETSSAELDLLNMDDSQDNARFAPTVGGQAPNSAYKCQLYRVGDGAVQYGSVGFLGVPHGLEQGHDYVVRE